MNDAYIFIGSNIERETNYPLAVERLRRLGTVLAVSPVYDTPALGNAPNTPRFFNGAARLLTELTPHALRNALRAIESELGRVRTADKNAPRTIDLDLVLYDHEIIGDNELKIPDLKIFECGFMARALADVNPDYIIPPDGPTLAELADRLCTSRDNMYTVPGISSQVRQFVQNALQTHATAPQLPACVTHAYDNDRSQTTMPDHTITSYAAQQHETSKLKSQRAIAAAVRTILVNVGEDPTREGLRKTPERVARAYNELLSGYAVNPVSLVNGALFESIYDDMVVVKDIEFYSLCEHHMLPFFGKAHVAYIPDGKIIGLSKIPRIVEMYARRLQVQEKMTREIADFIQSLLSPRGVAVIVTGQHMCATMRGVNQTGSKMLTQTMYGAFQERIAHEQLNDRLRQTE
ncbi:MAG: GTP cyclohydrolase I FolE [Candidatus Brocadiaceae bacterium]|nr:GTP cyclohydrolase I FolE [Candidatus Brocadiaceae bacterium]